MLAQLPILADLQCLQKGLSTVRQRNDRLIRVESLPVSQFSQQTIKVFSEKGQKAFRFEPHSSNQASEHNTQHTTPFAQELRNQETSYMKRLVLMSLTTLTLTAVAAPAFALSDRFETELDRNRSNLSDRTEQARESTLNKLNDRFETELDRNRSNLSDRTEQARESTLNKLNDRFETELDRNRSNLSDRTGRARQETLDRTSLSDPTQRARQATLDK